MKRLLHYLFLAAALIGLPLGCAWIGGKGEMLADVVAFPPKGDDRTVVSAEADRVLMI